MGCIYSFCKCLIFNNYMKILKIKLFFLVVYYN
nr:MAG TPA: hypothetical protein [Caudoviricetes sp.]